MIFEFYKILSEIEEYFSDKELEFKDEVDSRITHFLHNPFIKPPFMPDDEYELLVKNILHFDNGKIADGQQFLLNFDKIPYPPPSEPHFTFIDLFAGIGGFRIAMQEQGGKCIFSSEWDKYAQKTYFENFGEVPYGDIRIITEKYMESIPKHDVLCAGFPCQPFSLAGVSKKKSLGRKHGFEDETQGTLFFNIAQIIAKKRPKAFFLENVKNLEAHDSGNTFKVIRKTIEELDYEFNYKVVDGANWVPQHRERIFIIGFDKNCFDIEKEEIQIPDRPDSGFGKKELNQIVEPVVDEKYTLGPGTWETLKRHKAYHESVGNGFGYGLHNIPIEDGTVTRTISARYHKDGAEILIEQQGKRPRRLTVDEAKQLQGYDKKFKFPVSNTQAYRQIGNSVVVPAITDVSRILITLMKEKDALKRPY